MDEAGIVAVMSPVRDVATKGDQVLITTDGGCTHSFYRLYSALGDTVRPNLGTVIK